MAAARSKKSAAGPGWLASLLGATFLIVSGFLLGLVVGVVKEEPELVVGHLAGRSEEISWTDEEPAASAQEAAVDRVPGERIIGDEYAYAEGQVPVDLPEWGEPVASAPKPAVEPPPARKPSPVSAPPPGSRQGYSVQVGAFAASESAREVADDLRRKGYPVYTTPSSGSKDGRWRVRVGPLTDKQEAMKVAERLKVEERLPTWVRSEGGG
jgi:cell division septation protein DedD